MVKSNRGQNAARGNLDKAYLMHKALQHRVIGAAVALWHAAERALQWATGRTWSKKTPSVIFHDGRGAIATALDALLARTARANRSALAVVLELDDFLQIEATLSRDEQEHLFWAISAKLRKVLGSSDTMARLEGPRFGFALSSPGYGDLEGAIQSATRLQHALADPVPLGCRLVSVSSSIGFALPERMELPNGAALLRAAGLAQIEAARAGPQAIRSYSSNMEHRIRSRGGLLDQVGQALHDGQFIASFQPQVHLESGRITGFEALARWHHPTRGLIPPAEFMPALEESGQLGRLGKTMLSQSLEALSDWDRADLNVPQVSVNLTNVELRDPGLVDHIKFMLDEFDLSPSRLVIEVLETVVSFSQDDLIETTLERLAQMGCGIDLDDFGTGHASITSIRKFAVNRIKIDRSFVTNIDKDVEQQNMVSAILTMADRLGLATLAEGVETAREREMLRAMGCDVMQGFELARPMSQDEASRWIAAQEAIYQAPTHLRRVH